MCELDAGQPVRCAAARVAPLLVIVVGATVLPITATQASPAPGSQALRSSVPPSSAVAIPTGADAQALVAHNPAGTAFIIETGIHADFSVIPKSQDTFYADPGAILDGLGILPSAFREVLLLAGPWCCCHRRLGDLASRDPALWLRVSSTGRGHSAAPGEPSAHQFRPGGSSGSTWSRTQREAFP